MNVLYELHARRLARTLTAVALALSTTFVYAQSTDKGHPTRLFSGEIKGRGTGQLTEYWYSFNAGPGQVSVTIDVRSKGLGSSASLKAVLADSLFNEMASLYQGSANGVSAQKGDRFEFPKAQPVLLKLVVDDGVAQYSVGISGAVKFADSPAPVTAAAPSASAGAAASDSRLACIPKSGILRIEMEDGSAQEINLARARRMFVKP